MSCLPECRQPSCKFTHLPGSPAPDPLSVQYFTVFDYLIIKASLK